MGETDTDTNTYDVVIIGGGPAGASAAIYTARSAFRTLVIDKGITAGALGITEKISNYPGVPGPISGAELVEIIRRQAESFGATFITDKVVGVDFSSEPKVVMGATGTFHARAIILATGSMGRTSTVPGEEQLLGRGVSYCATCDGAFFQDRTVAVVGFNDEALEEALFLTRFARKIFLIVSTPDFKARQHLVEEVRASPVIEVLLGTRFKAIVGENQVEGIRIQSRESKEDEVLPVEGVFVFLQGAKPVTDYLMGQVQLTENGCVQVDREFQTSVPGVFAVGDLLCSHIKQAIIAAAEGVTAAIHINKYLSGSQKLKVDWS